MLMESLFIQISDDVYIYIKQNVSLLLGLWSVVTFVFAVTHIPATSVKIDHLSQGIIHIYDIYGYFKTSFKQNKHVSKR